MNAQEIFDFDPLANRSNYPKRALVVLSGGQDSTTCLALAKHHGYEVHAITFDYGQRHSREISAAIMIAEMFGVATHKLVRLPDNVLESTSPLVDKSQQLEQYADHASLPGGLEKTFVPFRNQLFLTIAANRAYALNCPILVTGLCQEDFGGYPDCRQEFVEVFAAACHAGTFCENPYFKDNNIDFGIWTPLMHLTKAETVKLAALIPGAYSALSFTHTGYDGAYPPTGKDHATLLRAKGFEEAGLPDPLVMRAVDEELMEMPDTANYSGDAIRLSIELMMEHDATMRG